jgi:site-specific DNA-methyltransferase (cytosine-N4-specific)
MTRFNLLHPYPAMIADELAIDLAAKFVVRGMRVLDPFCGTGRTLIAAAERGANCVGIDVNPLAVLVTRAKVANVRVSTLRRLSEEMGHGVPKTVGQEFDLEPGRSVSWFSRRCRRELREIICWLNTQRLRREDKLLLAAILSATARETSYCRQDQWKLHRIPPRKRLRFKKSPWSVFARRCRSALDELESSASLEGRCRALQGDTRNLLSVLRSQGGPRSFDLIITSPPYGDSHTTVGYGGISGICLGVIQHLDLPDISLENRCSIDRLCLGGGPNHSTETSMWPYWYGGTKNPGRPRVTNFLFDVEHCCKQISKVLRPGGRVVYVVARRTVSGYRVYLDAFLQSIMTGLGFVLEYSYSRSIRRKNTPYVVDTSGKKKSAQISKNQVKTMRTEYVLVFCKKVKGMNRGGRGQAGVQVNTQPAERLRALL